MMELSAFFFYREKEPGAGAQAQEKLGNHTLRTEEKKLRKQRKKETKERTKNPGKLRTKNTEGA